MQSFCNDKRKLLNRDQERASVSTSNLLDNIQINASAYVVVMLDVVHENTKNMNLEVPPDDMTLTLWVVISRRVQWTRTYIDVDPSAAASTSTTSQLNTAPASIFLETCVSPSPIREQFRPSPLQTRSTPLPAPYQTWPPTTLPKMMKNVRGKTQLQQQKMLSKATKGKQLLQQTTATMQANQKFVMGLRMLTVDELHKAG
jgi:hypothetical protein